MKDTKLNITDLLHQMIRDEIKCSKKEIKAKLMSEIVNENKPFLTLDDVCNLTGLCKTTIYQYCNQGKIGYYKPSGKKLFFSMNNIQEFIFNEKHYYKPKSEIRQAAQTKYIKRKIE